MAADRKRLLLLYARQRLYGDRMAEDGRKYYYFNGNGKLVRGWADIDGKRYFLQQDGTMLTGWQTIDGLLYYFDASGAMAAGWTKLDGYWYYFNNEGKLMTGWMQLDGKFYYLHTDGRMVIGWQSDGTNKYYMDTVSGVMSVGWKHIEQSWYYFNQSGHMITGWLNDGGKYYYLNPADGKMVSNGSFVVNNVNYTFNQNGVCLSETSAIDGGSAGSVYTPGTAGLWRTEIIWVLRRRGIRRTALRVIAEAEMLRRDPRQAVRQRLRPVPRPLDLPRRIRVCRLVITRPADRELPTPALALHQLQPRAAIQPAATIYYTNTGSMTGPGSSNTNYNYSSGSSGTAAPGSSGSSSSSSNLTEYQTGGPK